MKPGFLAVGGCSDKKISRYVYALGNVPREMLFTDAGIARIAAFLERSRATGIAAVNEHLACWLLSNRDSLPSRVSLWCPSGQTLEKVASKLGQAETARKTGLDVLPTYRIVSEDDVANVSPDHFPLALRASREGDISPHFKAKFVDNSDELRLLMRSLAIRGEGMIGQPFIAGRTVMVHGARNCRGEHLAICGFAAEFRLDGFAVVLKPIPISDEMRGSVAAFADHYGITGTYHMDFIAGTELTQMFFLEINCRLGGTTGKVFACGYDEPLLLLGCYEEAIRSAEPMRLSRRVTNRQALLRYSFRALRGKLGRLDYPLSMSPSVVTSLIAGFLLARDEVWSWGDPGGSIVLLRGSLVRRLKTRGRQ